MASVIDRRSSIFHRLSGDNNNFKRFRFWFLLLTFNLTFNCPIPAILWPANIRHFFQFTKDFTYSTRWGGPTNRRLTQHNSASILTFHLKLFPRNRQLHFFQMSFYSNFLERIPLKSDALEQRRTISFQRNDFQHRNCEENENRTKKSVMPDKL